MTFLWAHWRRPWPAMVLTAALAVVLYARAFGFAFYFDDPALNMPIVAHHSLPEIMFTYVQYGYYRPVTFALWKLLYWLGGSRYGVAFHVLPVALHAANMALLWLLAYGLSGRHTYAWVVALAATTFPLSYEAVGSSAALFHPLLLFWALLAILCYRRARCQGPRWLLAPAGAFLVLAQFTHENGVMVAVLVVVWELLFQPPHSMRDVLLRPAWLGLVVPLLFALTWLRVGGAPTGFVGGMSVPSNTLPFWQAIAYPLLPVVRLATTQRVGLVLLSLGVLGSLLALAVRAKMLKLWLFGLGWFVAMALPSILFLEHDYLYSGPRLMYLPAVGVALLWGLVPLTVEDLCRRAHTRPWLALGAQSALVAAVTLPALPFVHCQLDFMAHTTRLLRTLRACAEQSPSDRELVYVNLPYYYTAYAQHPDGCPSCYPHVTLLTIVFPPYGSVRDALVCNGGPSREARAVRCPALATTWVAHGEEMAASVLRDIATRATVFVCDVEAGRLWDVSAVLASGARTGPWDSRVPWTFVEPLVEPPELPRPGELDSATPAGIGYGDALELMAYRLESEAIMPGDACELLLFWRALGESRPDAHVSLEVLDRFGGALVRSQFAPVAGLPTSEWLPGSVYVSRYRIEIAAGAPFGPASVHVGLGDAVGSPLAARDASGSTLGIMPRITALLIGQPSGAGLQTPQPVYPRREVLGGQIALLGYDLPSAVATPGESIAPVLYWQSSQVLDTNLTVFVQLLDGTGKLVAQQDCEPNGGRYPTTAWRVGEVVLDAHEIELPTDLPEGAYTLAIGMYAWPDLRRLPVALDGTSLGDMVRLAAITVVR